MIVGATLVVARLWEYIKGNGMIMNENELIQAIIQIQIDIKNMRTDINDIKNRIEYIETDKKITGYLLEDIRRYISNVAEDTRKIKTALNIDKNEIEILDDGNKLCV